MLRLAQPFQRNGDSKGPQVLIFSASAFLNVLALGSFFNYFP